MVLAVICNGDDSLIRLKMPFHESQADLKNKHAFYTWHVLDAIEFVMALVFFYILDNII